MKLHIVPAYLMLAAILICGCGRQQSAGKPAQQQTGAAVAERQEPESPRTAFLRLKRNIKSIDTTLRRDPANTAKMKEAVTEIEAFMNKHPAEEKEWCEQRLARFKSALEMYKAD